MAWLRSRLRQEPSFKREPSGQQKVSGVPYFEHTFSNRKAEYSQVVAPGGPQRRDGQPRPRSRWVLNKILLKVLCTHCLYLVRNVNLMPTGGQSRKIRCTSELRSPVRVLPLIVISWSPGLSPAWPAAPRRDTPVTRTRLPSTPVFSPNFPSLWFRITCRHQQACAVVR